MNNITISNVDNEAEAKELLARSSLDIVLAGVTGDTIQAAHSATKSVLALRLDGSVYVILMEGDSKEERKARYYRVLDLLIKNHGGEIIGDNGC